MKYYAPDYFENFRCIADKCRHSCCIGWEIDIDEDTLALYDTVGGELGEKLQKCISREGDCAHFILGEKDRCPFLNDKNLCRLILELGDGSLCDICADHPRFRNFYAHRIEEGLGLSCEEAARLILTNTEKVRLVCTEDDGEECSVNANEVRFITLRDKIIELLQNRDVPVDMRLMGVLQAVGVTLPELDMHKIKALYLDLEMLERDWKEYLDLLTAPVVKFTDSLETAYEQLLVYLVYRHLSACDISGTLKFCAVSYIVICRICEVLGGTMNSLREVCRRYSSEIEYSDENVQKIIDGI